MRGRGRGGRFNSSQNGLPQEQIESLVRRNSPMVGMQRWSESEFGVLWLAVSRYGRRWQAIVDSGMLPTRGARAVEQAWSAFCARGISAMPAVPNPGAGLPAGLVAGVVSPLPLELLPQRDRCVQSGRPWDYVVHRTSSPRITREPTDRQKILIRNWNLGNARGRGLLLCNLRRAEEKLRRYFTRCLPTHASVGELILAVPIPVQLRDQLGMVLYPGEAGATVTRSCAGSNWVGGESAGAMRFITSVEVAGFMGISSGRGGPCAVAQSYYTEYQLCGLLAESVRHLARSSSRPPLWCLVPAWLSICSACRPSLTHSRGRRCLPHHMHVPPLRTRLSPGRPLSQSLSLP